MSRQTRSSCIKFSSGNTPYQGITRDHMRNAIRRNRRFTLALAAGVVWCLTATSTVRGQGSGPLPYRPGIDVSDYAISLDLPERGASIAGRAVLTVRRWAPVDTLVLDLVRLKVDSVL